MDVTGKVCNLGPTDISYSIAISTVPGADKHQQILIIILIIISKSVL